jgi:hypothetical protein
MAYYFNLLISNRFPSFARFKYKTYGHPQYGAFNNKLENLHADLELVYRCLHNMSNSDNTAATAQYEKLHQLEEGGLSSTLGPWPVYFNDAVYRERKLQSLQDEYESDEIARQAYRKNAEAAFLTRMDELIKRAKDLSSDSE